MRKNIRIMRKSPALGESPALRALFPTIRGGLLAATLTQPDKWWYLSELAQFLGTTPSALQRELTSLVAGGILQRRREGTRSYFKADARSPLFPELRGLMEKTAGVLPALRQVLNPFGSRITAAFVYGSVASGREHAQSDVDLLVVGSVGLADLAPDLRHVEARLGRDVNATSYSEVEFRRSARAQDHFLSHVLRGARRFVKGNQRDLDELAGKPRRPTPSHVEKRTR